MGGAYPGGRRCIGAVQGCPMELWTRLVGVMEIVATGEEEEGGGRYWVPCFTDAGSLTNDIDRYFQLPLMCSPMTIGQLARVLAHRRLIANMKRQTQITCITGSPYSPKSPY